MSTLFEELDRLLKSMNEAEEAPETAAEKAEKIVKAIPISPELETADQGVKKAQEKIAKYFYNLKMGSSKDDELHANDEIDLPDTWMDPKMKGEMSGKMEDKAFDKNSVVWDDEEEMEKLQKDVEVDMHGSDTEFDDFDYRDNQFGDDADMDDVNMDDLEGGGGGGDDDDSKTEDEKLREAIDDAIDTMSDDGLDDDEEGEGGQKGGQGGSKKGNDHMGPGGDPAPGMDGDDDDEDEEEGEGGQPGGNGKQGKPGLHQDDPKVNPGPGGDPAPGGEEGDDDENEEGGEGGQPGSGGKEGKPGPRQDDPKVNPGHGGDGEDGEDGEDGDDNDSGTSTSKSGGMSKKDQKLKDLKKALDNNDSEGVNQSIDEIKEGSDDAEMPGEQIGEVSEKDIQGDMEKAGIAKEDIERMKQASKEDKRVELDDENAKALKKQVVDGLEKKCAKRGGSALARTIVKQALKSKVNDDEWREMLKLFLKTKSVNSGKMSKTRSGMKWGHKNHLWRDAVLPTSAESTGTIQNIFCFIDFSGSVNQDLVYTFLGRVIDLCAELNYTNVVIYGFGEQIVLPKEITGRMLKRYGKDVVLSQTWDYIDSQDPGGGTENFRDVAEEIMKIRYKQKDAVYLIFGDALWGDRDNGPICLKTICGEKLLDRMCILTYYDPSGYWYESYRGYISLLKEIVGLKNVICTKASHIKETKS